MLNKKIEKLTTNLLRSMNIKNVDDIDLQFICRENNINLKSENLENNISGLLVIKNGISHIVYNSKDLPQRQRFTIAHELGHYFLHKDSLIFVDTDKVLYRNDESKKGEYKKEIEANSFSASLLMPESFIIEEINSLNRDYLRIDDIEILAKKFKVSVQAMSFRLSNLGFYF